MSTKARAEARRAARGKEPADATQTQETQDPLPEVVLPEIVPDDLREDALWALGFKNFAVSVDMFETGDVPPLISLYRDGDLLLHAISPNVDRDLGLWFLTKAVPGYNAEAATFFADTHMTGGRFFEEKGRIPDPHEMQHLCDDEGACELGLTTDGIFMMHATRAEPNLSRFVNFPYHVNKNVKRVHWQSDVVFMDERDPNVSMSGTIANVVRSTMEAPPDELAHTMLHLQGDPVYNRFMMDMYLTAQFTMVGYPVLWAAKTDEERALVDETLTGLGVSSNFGEPTKEPSAAMQYLAAKLRLELREHGQRTHEAELAEAARRQAERGETPASWTQPRSSGGH